MGQDIKFSVKIKEEDLYSYNIFHAYHSSQGIISIILFVLLVAVWILRFTTLSIAYRVLYPIVAVIFLLYIPLTLRARVKVQMKQDVFMYPLTYELKEDGLWISSQTADEPAELPWEYIYKIATWKGYLLIYSNRVNAYIIPIKDIQSEYSNIIDFIKLHVEDYKLQIKYENNRN